MAETPGYKTSEFWIALLVVLTSCGVVSIQVWRNKIDTATAISLISMAATAFGYAQSRAAVKSVSKEDADAKE